MQYGDIAAANAHLLAGQPDRIAIPLRDGDVDCDEGICTMSEHYAQWLMLTIIQQAQAITGLNDVIEDQVKGNNTLVNTLTECEYAAAKKDEAILQMEKQGAIKDLVSVGKQFAIAGVCALLLH